jgi:hypothetical protein
VAHVDLGAGGDTLLAVVLGAALATVGGVVAGQIEFHQIRSERERNAGLLFGEVLAGLNMILQLAGEARGRGEPYGPITMRILTAAHRETHIYERNRELLFALRDAKLRARTHILLLQMSLTLDAVFETSQADRKPDAQGVAALDGPFDFLQELRAEIPGLLAKYRKIARYAFDAHNRVANEDLDPLLRRPPGGSPPSVGAPPE